MKQFDIKKSRETGWKLEGDVATIQEREGEKNDDVGDRRKKSWNNIFETVGRSRSQCTDGGLVFRSNNSVIHS